MCNKTCGYYCQLALILALFTLTLFFCLYRYVLIYLWNQLEPRTNLSKQDKTWAKVSTLDMGVIVCAMELHS
jgi:hypothetical protein